MAKSLTKKEFPDSLIQQAKSVLNTDPARALIVAKQAIQMSVNREREERTFELYALCGEAYLHLNKTDSARYWLNESFKGLKNSNNIVGKIKAQNLLSQVYLSEGKYQLAESTALETFNQCTLELGKNGNRPAFKELTAEVLSTLVLVYVKEGNNELAREKLLHFIHNRNNGETFADMLIQANLGTVYQATGNYDSSLYRFEIALNIAKRLKDPLNTEKNFANIAGTYYAMGKYTLALKYYNSALEIIKPLNNPARLAVLYNNIAALYRKINYYEKAMQYFIASVRIKETLNDSIGLAATYNNIGLVYSDWSNFPMAEKYLRQAVRINSRINNRKSLSVNYIGLGSMYMIRGLADSAVHYYSKAYELKKGMGQKSGMIIALHGLGNTYSELLQNDLQAFRCYSQALGIATELESEFDIADINKSMGKVFFNQKRYRESEEAFLKALSYAQKENVTDMLLECSKYLTQIKIGQGEPKAALRYFKVCLDANDSLYSQEKVRAIMDLKIRYESEKQEENNAMLLEKNKLQQSRISILVVLLVMVMMLILVILVLYVQKSKAYFQIVQTNLELMRSEKFQMAADKPVREHQQKTNPVIKEEASTDDLLAKLTHLMEAEKLYLDPCLSLDSFSRRLNTNRTYLSHIINRDCKCNFNSFINHYRIKDARKMLTEEAFDHLSIEGIGQSVGFNSKVSFHTHFKDQIGVTPSYFRKTAALQRKQD